MEIDTRYDFSIDQRTLADPNNTVSLQLSLLGERKRVLELGCATGRVTRLLRDVKQCRVTAIEFSPTAAELARPYCDQLWIGDLESPAFRKTIQGEFEVILAGDVLEHLRDPQAVLADLRSRLSANGYWIISVPNIAHWSIRRNLFSGRFDYTQTGIMDRTHATWFTLKTLEKMISDAGYRVTESRAVCTLPAQNQLRLSKLAARLGQFRWARELLGFQLVIKAVPADVAPVQSGSDINESAKEAALE